MIPEEEHGLGGNTVFLVDDDPSVLKALTRLLEAEGFRVRAFESPVAFLAEHDTTTPGCAVFDVGLGTRNGVDLMLELARAGQMRPTIFITGVGDIPTSVRAMKSGAMDFLTKPVERTTLLDAVRSAIAFDCATRERHSDLAQIRQRLSSLTRRETEVLASVVRGRANKQIAYDLTIAEKTVKVHRASVMKKMAVRTVAQLVGAVQRARN